MRVRVEAISPWERQGHCQVSAYPNLRVEKMKDNIPRLRSDAREKPSRILSTLTRSGWPRSLPRSGCCAKGCSKVNKATKNPHDKMKEALVEIGVHHAPTKITAFDTSYAMHAKAEDHLGY